MEIVRVINDVKHTIRLTSEELFEAYEEEQHNLDVDDIKDYFNGFSDDNYVEYFGLCRNKLTALTDEMATEMRRNIDKYDMHWDTARDEAINTVIRRHTAE